ncbi:Zn-ribbon domain-containing OB-fold protein [Nocardia miyunensis]|uniref:Zn-ribbon domain-containing OB-fold protein n=1 Tax=Nocardia miyunensis TaxID=282684 RepID=UPI00082E1A15|nr:OB-fold domain-containing protein [Nocardia miyunensis]
MLQYRSKGSEVVGETADNHTETVFMIRRCPDCSKLFAPLITNCPSCPSASLTWAPSRGTGSIVSWKVVHRQSTEHHGEWEPSTIAIVELDDGPWVYTAIEGEMPPPSAQPVRVRFEPRPTYDRFPVFAIDTSEGSDRDSSRRPKPARSNCQNEPVSKTMKRAQSDSGRASAWVRSALDLCDFLRTARSVDAEAISVIEFAIRWAPARGASTSDLLVNFGVTRWRFVEMVRESLQPRASDSRHAAALKRNLLDSLTWAWRMYPDSRESRPVAVPALVDRPRRNLCT